MALLAVMTGIFCGEVVAQTEIPDDSLARIQDMYGRLWNELYAATDDFWHHGDYERCIALNRLITAMDPHAVEVYGSGAWLMQNQLRDDEAEVYLLQGLNDNRDVYDLYFELGYFYYMHERFDEAISHLEAATQLAAPVFVWHMLAHSYEHAGNRSEALRIWMVREGATPDNPVPRLQINRILEGRPPSTTPEMARHAREARKQEEREQNSHDY